GFTPRADRARLRRGDRLDAEVAHLVLHAAMNAQHALPPRVRARFGVIEEMVPRLRQSLLRRGFGDPDARHAGAVWARGGAVHPGAANEDEAVIEAGLGDPSVSRRQLSTGNDLPMRVDFREQVEVLVAHRARVGANRAVRLAHQDVDELLWADLVLPFHRPPLGAGELVANEVADEPVAVGAEVVVAVLLEVTGRHEC